MKTKTLEELIAEYYKDPPGARPYILRHNPRLMMALDPEYMARKEPACVAELCPEYLAVHATSVLACLQPKYMVENMPKWMQEHKPGIYTLFAKGELS